MTTPTNRLLTHADDYPEPHMEPDRQNAGIPGLVLAGAIVVSVVLWFAALMAISAVAGYIAVWVA